MSSIDEEIVLVFNERVVTLILNRPDKGNLLTPTMVETLLKYVPKLAVDPDVRALVITGAGETFCAGLDISDDIWSPTESINQRLAWFSSKVNLLVETVNIFPKTAIARINGPAIGAGVGLLLACDIRLSVEEAYFSFPESKLGFIQSLAPMSALNQVSKHRLSDYALTGRHVSADEAVESFLNGVVESQDELDIKLKEYTDLLVIKDPMVVEATKKLINVVICGDSKRRSSLALAVQNFSRTIIGQAKEAEGTKSLKQASTDSGCSQG